jgi:hypothetical protein
MSTPPLMLRKKAMSRAWNTIDRFSNLSLMILSKPLAPNPENGALANMFMHQRKASIRLSFWYHYESMYCQTLCTTRQTCRKVCWINLTLIDQALNASPGPNHAPYSQRHLLRTWPRAIPSAHQSPKVQKIQKWKANKTCIAASVLFSSKDMYNYYPDRWTGTNLSSSYTLYLTTPTIKAYH